MDDELILAGDVGGTKTYLALCDARQEGFKPLFEARYDTRGHESLAALLQAFVHEAGMQPSCVVVGVPGPVRQLPVRAVNLPWMIDPQELRAALGVDQVHLLNDLEATAYGTQVLTGADWVELNSAPVDPQGNVAVIAAGTGLGEGGLCWTGTRYTAIASEGGHATFSPSDPLEAELWTHLHQQRRGHVSWERIVSGPGLVSIYEFLRSRGEAEEPGWLREELEGCDDRAGVIGRVAQEGTSELASRALEMFISLYGEEAGNLALKLMATGGVFVGGGIAPKIVERLGDGRFMKGFLNKGRLKQALSAVPVRVVLNDKTGLMGAAYRGAQLMV